MHVLPPPPPSPPSAAPTHLQPFQLKDLQLVSAGDAAFVVLMYPDLAAEATGMPSRHPGGAQGPPQPQPQTQGEAEGEADLQLRSDAEALNAMTVAALSTLDACPGQKLVVQVLGAAGIGW